jgi:hypothetical protein
MIRVSNTVENTALISNTLGNLNILYYTPICAHGPPFDTTPTLLYKPIGILDGGNSNSGSGISLTTSRCEITTKRETIAINIDSASRIRKRFDCNLKKKY